MNAVTVLKSTETIGAKEFRSRLPDILRNPKHPYRVMLQNKYSVAVLPDEQFMEILELLQELLASGQLDKVLGQLQEESKRKNPWFWTKAWQKAQRASEKDVKAGRVRRYGSADELFKALDK